MLRPIATLQQLTEAIGNEIGPTLLDLKLRQ